ncbi:MAG: sugar nucleotide-binding protein [Magnetococcales bacterium]|nr:sugar nucleotide-binding protein [Magnetococcales bacterium]
MNTTEKQILVLGGSGYIGQSFIKLTGWDNVLATYRSRPFSGGVFFDPSSVQLSDIFDGRGPFSHALILMGDTHMDSCARDPDRSKRINVNQILAIATELFVNNIKPIFISTDMVFGGDRGNYTENDHAEPIVMYGKQKRDVEKFFQKSNRDYLIIRLSKVYGSELSDGTQFTQWLEAISHGEQIALAADQIFCPIFVSDVIDGIKIALKKNMSGLYHLAGPHAMNRVQMFTTLCKCLEARFGKLPPLATKHCSINDFNFLEKRPLNCSMASEKFIKATGLHPRPAESICRTIVESIAKWPMS